MVPFYIGSVSRHVGNELKAAGIPVQSVESRRAVSQFKTNIHCKEAGPFSCPLVVCVLPIPKELLERTVAVTSRLGSLAGPPIHIGDPSLIGIKDISRPDYGDPPNMEDNVPVFWLSSLTAHLAVKSAGEYCFLYICSITENIFHFWVHLLKAWNAVKMVSWIHKMYTEASIVVTLGLFYQKSVKMSHQVSSQGQLCRPYQGSSAWHR